ncbi:hypothetical protein JHK85_034042 [Glycine max]|nr:hypothetical protein JHK85_034042 [Glycine max]KAG4985717.1 hypothetical protein JHK86_033408 [Glycine max]
MDPGSCDTFDLGYYKQVVKRMGLFQSDVSLLESSNTRAIIIRQLQSTQGFFAEFAKSMEKMGRINVKIETKGEIRKHCTMLKKSPSFGGRMFTCENVATTLG